MTLYECLNEWIGKFVIANENENEWFVVLMICLILFCMKTV